jgi:hypothetical protein
VVAADEGDVVDDGVTTWEGAGLAPAQGPAFLHYEVERLRGRWVVRAYVREAGHPDMCVTWQTVGTWGAVLAAFDDVAYPVRVVGQARRVVVVDTTAVVVGAS